MIVFVAHEENDIYAWETVRKFRKSHLILSFAPNDDKYKNKVKLDLEEIKLEASKRNFKDFISKND